jgi:addiction module HigA family antidote
MMSAVLDGKANIIYEIPSSERVLGYKPEEYKRRDFMEFLHPDDFARVSGAFTSLLNNPGGTYRDEVRARHKDGSWGTIEMMARNMLDDPIASGIIMVTKTDAYPDVAIPPGEYLAEELKARGMFQKELARRMGRPLNAINEIIHGKKAITAETALQLEDVMPEIPARFWLNLETDYQLTKVLINKRTKTA